MQWRNTNQNLSNLKGIQCHTSIKPTVRSSNPKVVRIQFELCHAVPNRIMLKELIRNIETAIKDLLVDSIEAII